MTQKLVSWKRRLLIISMKNILLLQNLTVESFAARLSQANVITKTDFDAKLSSFNRKIIQIKQKTIFVKIN